MNYEAIPVTAQFEVNALGALDETVFEPATGVTDERVIRNLIDAVYKPLLTVLSCRSASELEEKRDDVWNNYFRSFRALGDTIARVLSKDQLAMSSHRGSVGIVRDLARFRGVLFSEEIAQQFEFSDWLLTRIQAAGHKIAHLGRASEVDRAGDIQLSSDFLSVAAWGQFHYHCVLASMKFSLPIAEGIQEQIRDGMRAWVNAAAIIEEALALRTGETVGGEIEVVDAPWDEEDEYLLDESMRDHLSHGV